MEKRSLQTLRKVELRGDDKKPLIFGYGAVFYDGTPETQYEMWEDCVERIMPGAFDRAVRESQDVRGLFNHDCNMILGRTSAGTCRLTIDKIGLGYEIDPNLDDPDAVGVMAKLRRGDVSGSSFSFLPVERVWREVDGLYVCEIIDVDLYDVGPVTFPAYEGSSSGLRALRSEDSEATRRELQEWNQQKTVLTKELSDVRSRSAEVAQFLARH